MATTTPTLTASSTSLSPSPSASPSSSSPFLLSQLCPYCNLQPPKYRCPACSARTCSLTCSKRHKVFNQCSGVRDPTKYIKRSQLLTPTALDRDYNYLTTVEKAITYPSVRHLNEIIDEESKERNVRLQRVMTEAENRGVKVIQAPTGLKRARENKTAVTGSQKKRKTLKWTVELIIRDGDIERRVLDERVPENLRLYETISSLLEIESKSERRRKLESTHVYLKDALSPTNRPTLIEIPIDKSLRDVLQGKTVLEFPTIYVCDKAPKGFTIIEGVAPSAGASANSAADATSKNSTPFEPAETGCIEPAEDSNQTVGSPAAPEKEQEIIV